MKGMAKNGFTGEEGRDIRITAQSTLNATRQLERGEDGRTPECGRRLPAALVAVADVDRQGLWERCLEGYGAALAGSVHFCVLFFSFLFCALLRLELQLSARRDGRRKGEVWA